MDIAEWHRSIVCGKLVGCLRGKENPDTVARFVRTMVGKGRIAKGDLGSIVEKVNRESVLPFGRQPERRRRLEAVVKALGMPEADTLKGGR